MSCKSLALIMVDAPKLRPNHIPDDAIVSFLCLPLSETYEQNQENSISCNLYQKTQETLKISNVSYCQSPNNFEDQNLVGNVFKSKDMNLQKCLSLNQKTDLEKEVQKKISSAQSQLSKKYRTQRSQKKQKSSNIMMFLERKLVQKSKKKQSLSHKQMI